MESQAGFSRHFKNQIFSITAMLVTRFCFHNYFFWMDRLKNFWERLDHTSSANLFRTKTSLSFSFCWNRVRKNYYLISIISSMCAQCNMLFEVNEESKNFASLNYKFLFKIVDFSIWWIKKVFDQFLRI